MRTTNSTADYERTHGRKPRGDGNWAFRLSVLTADGWTVAVEMFFARGTFTVARSLARSAAKTHATLRNASEALVEALG